MLFFIILFLLVISIIGCIFVQYVDDNYQYRDSKGFKDIIWCHSEELFLTTVALILVFSTIIGCMTAIMISRYTRAEADKAMNQEIYNFLVYKAETEAIRDDFGIINKEYIDEIQQWNSDLVKYQTITHNFWIGIFYPNWYDEFKTIDLYKIEMRGAIALLIK